jgi:hypothetical protein
MCLLCALTILALVVLLTVLHTALFTVPVLLDYFRTLVAVEFTALFTVLVTCPIPCHSLVHLSLSRPEASELGH